MFDNLNNLNSKKSILEFCHLYFKLIMRGISKYSRIRNTYIKVLFEKLWKGNQEK